jgi:hypothetical protein
MFKCNGLVYQPNKDVIAEKFWLAKLKYLKKNKSNRLAQMLPIKNNFRLFP